MSITYEDCSVFLLFLLLNHFSNCSCVSVGGVSAMIAVSHCIQHLSVPQYLCSVFCFVFPVFDELIWTVSHLFDVYEPLLFKVHCIFLNIALSTHMSAYFECDIDASKCYDCMCDWIQLLLLIYDYYWINDNASITIYRIARTMLVICIK